MSYQPTGKQVITGADAAVALVPQAGADSAQVTIEGAGVRYWIDGSIPTVSAGHLLSSGDDLFLEKLDLNRVKFFAPTGTSVFVSFINTDMAGA